MLFDRGVYVTLAAYPLVPKDEVGFRIQLTAANTDAEIDMLIAALEELAHRGELQPAPQRRTAARGGGLAMRGRARDSGASRSGRSTSAPARCCRALYVWVPPFAASGPVFNLLGLSPVVAIIVGVRRYKPASRGPWLWFAVGMLLFWLGDLYTYSYPRLFGADVPFPSLGDGAYVAVYPALMAGLLMLIRRRNPESDRAGVIDSLIMTLGLALLSWVALIAPYLHDETMTLTGKLVSVAYPLGDILLLAAAIRLAVDTGKRLPAFYLLASAIVALLVTDFAYGVVTLNGAYHGQVVARRRLDQLLPALGRRRPAPLDARARAAGARPRPARSRRCD